MAVEQGVSMHVTPIARILVQYSFTNREMAVLMLQERFSKYLPALKSSGEAEEMIRYGIVFLKRMRGGPAEVQNDSLFESATF